MNLYRPYAAFALVIALGGSAAVFAAAEHDAHHGAAAPVANAPAAMSEGTIKKVDKAAGKLTIAHGPLENLGMPPMTMVFRAADPAMLDRVKAGDKVRFVAEKTEGVFTVTKLEALQ
jgi:Cu/Ag efflux protein CusF